MSRPILITLLTSGALALGACGGGDPVAEVEDIPAGTTYVKLDSKFAKALDSLGLKPGTVGAANLAGGSLRFPITEGNVKLFEPGKEDPYVQGELKHDGSGLSLEAGDTKVALTNFKIDPGESELQGTVRANGKVVEEETPLFFLDGRTLEPVREVKDGVVLEGTTVRLKGGAAKLLNKTFDTDALKGGLKVGIAKIVVRTKVS